MKGFIKKVKIGLKIGVAGALLAGTIMSGAVAYSNMSLNDYSTDAQIEAFAEDLGCDLSYVEKEDNHYRLMKHNGNEPIYISFDDNLTEEEKEVISQALEYVFGFVSQINENYRYEIVDNVTYNLKFNKTRIYFSEGNCEKVNNLGENQENLGLASSKISLLSELTQKRVTKDHKIEFNREKIENNDDWYRIAIHEILHNFGFGDIYTDVKNKTTDKYYGNTYMRVESDIAQKFGILSPNDLRVLVSLYAHDNSNKERINKMVSDYDKEFYSKYANQCKTIVKTEEMILEESFKIIDDLHITDMDGTERGYIYEITIEQDLYKFEIFDLITGNKLESATGNVLRINGIIVLRDVELKNGLRPNNKAESYDGGVIRDLIVLSKDNKIGWYDLSTNDFRNFGVVESLEKDMGV